MALIESHHEPLKRLPQLHNLSYAWKDCLIPYPLKASFRNSWSWLTRWTNTLKSFCTSLAWRNRRFGKVVGRRVNGACSTVKYDFLDCMTRPWVKQWSFASVTKYSTVSSAGSSRASMLLFAKYQRVIRRIASSDVYRVSCYLKLRRY